MQNRQLVQTGRPRDTRPVWGRVTSASSPQHPPPPATPCCRQGCRGRPYTAASPAPRRLCAAVSSGGSLERHGARTSAPPHGTWGQSPAASGCSAGTCKHTDGQQWWCVRWFCQVGKNATWHSRKSTFRCHTATILLCVTPVSHTSSPDDPGLPMWDVLAKGGHLLLAGHLHGVLEVNVVAEAHLLVKQGGLAVQGQLVALGLQAADDTGRPL